MCCTEYSSIPNYLASLQLRERIAAIDILIDKAILALAAPYDSDIANVASYEIDDGQVRIKTGYRSTKEAFEAIQGLERMKIMYERRLNGRATVLIGRQQYGRGYRGGC